MNMFNRQCHLHEPIQNLVFTVTYLTYFFLISNFGIQVTSISIVHNNAKTSLIHKRFFVCDNVRMSHCFQNMHFVYSIFSLFPVHLWYIDDLHYVGLSVGDWLNEDGESKWSFTDYSKFSIFFHTFFKFQKNNINKLKRIR